MRIYFQEGDFFINKLILQNTVKFECVMTENKLKATEIQKHFLARHRVD